MPYRCFRLLLPCIILSVSAGAQTSFKTKYNNSSIFTGIEVGSKGVKMSVVEIGKNAQSSGAFNILKDTSVNTDFISFTPETFKATLDGLYSFYTTATKDYRIPSRKIFTVLSSGVKTQAAKDDRNDMIKTLIDSFRTRIGEPRREVEVVDVYKEAFLSHLGIVPESRRYTTFLLDIGSGNTKGGFFPGNSLQKFQLFQLTWGTKTVSNATEKRLEEDKSIAQFKKQLTRVLVGAENDEIIYSVNASGVYPVSDNIAFSGGIAWATATLLKPELVDNAVITVSYDEVERFCTKLYENYEALSPKILGININVPAQKEAAMKEIARVHKVFDQRALMSGAGLMLKIMRQFASVYETKQFYLVKNGQVGWISAYVEQTIQD